MNYLFQFITTVYSKLERAPADEIQQRQNKEIFKQLKDLSETKDFSKIKMGFNDKCPREVEKCHISTCTVPQMNLKDEQGVIDLLKIRESYSPGIRGSNLVWRDIYDIANTQDLLSKLVSGLHFSVTTHIYKFHTKLLNIYFSHPLQYQNKYSNEFQNNFNMLYNAVKIAVANLESNTGVVPESALTFSKVLKEVITRDSIISKSSSRFEKVNIDKNQKTFPGNLNGPESGEINKSMIDQEFDLLLKGLPLIQDTIIEKTNDIVRTISCLNCQKCILWGTIQTKGLKAAVKVLKNIPLYQNECIFLINLFRRLSVSMVESENLLDVKIPYLNLIAICYRQVFIILITKSLLILGYLKIYRYKKNKAAKFN